MSGSYNRYSTEDDCWMGSIKSALGVYLLLALSVAVPAAIGWIIGVW